MHPKHTPSPATRIARAITPIRSAVACLAVVSLAATAQTRMDEPMAAGLIIKFRDGAQSAVAVNATMQGARAHALGRGLAISGEREAAMGARVLHLERHVPASSLLQVARELQNYDSSIEYVQPNYVLHPTFTPNDTYFSQQWALTDPVAGISAPKAWDINRGFNVRVGVVDTGVRPHADLIGNLLPAYDFISSSTASNDGNGRDSSYYDSGDWVNKNECGANKPAENSSWHGTHVAGIVAAMGNNAQGVSGVAPAAQVLPVRALGRCGGAWADIADAALWAAGVPVPGAPANPYPVHILNLSLGATGTCGTHEQQTIDKLVSMGVLVVVAAGNDNVNASTAFPANCKGSFVVAATNAAGGKAGFSNFGGPTAIAAPGAGIVSTLNTGVKDPASDTYANMSGTSMAAPHVAGVAALMSSVNPTISMSTARILMQETAAPFSDGCTTCGSGIVNAEKAVIAARAFRPEKEPNGTLATAQVLLGSLNDVWGAIESTSSTDDEDLYMVTLPPLTVLKLDLINMTSNFDLDMQLLDKTGKLLYKASSGGPGKNEYLQPSNLDDKVTLTYYVKVVRGALSARSTQPQAYRLKVARTPVL